MTMFCSNMFWENKIIENNSYSEEYFDLFMENSEYCILISIIMYSSNYIIILLATVT